MIRRVPGPGQESVWDYPRPPRLEAEPRPVRIILSGVTIVDSSEVLRILETSHPPNIYVPRGDVTPEVLQRNPQRGVMAALAVVKGRPRRGSPLMTTPLADMAGQEGLWLRTLAAWGAWLVWALR